MTDTTETGKPTEPPAGGRPPCEANAYAIIFRLLGKRRDATDAARRVASGYLSEQDADPCEWLPDLALDAVEASLAVSEDIEVDDAFPSRRDALVRRLRTMDDRSRVAAALRHLAGYDAERVAELMDIDAATVEELAAPLAPPPGETWRELGDPALRSRLEPVRRPRRHRRVPWRWLLAGATVVVVVLAAARLSGPRPVLGRFDPGAGDRSFGESVDPLASAGCALQGGEAPEVGPGVSSQSVDLGGQSTAYRLRAPVGDDPAPLLVALPGRGQTAAQFAEVTQIEAAFPEALVATLEPPAPSLEWNASGDPGSSDDLAATIALTEELITGRCVDLTRVHVIGMGTGGQLAGALACAAPELYASATMVAGSLMPEGCILRPDVAALFAANVDDSFIRPTGGYGPDSVTGSGSEGPERAEAEPMDEVAADWARAVGTDEERTLAEADDTLVVTRTGENGVEVTTVLHPGGGHSWGLGDTVLLADFLPRSARSG